MVRLASAVGNTLHLSPAACPDEFLKNSKETLSL
jgi:hypothetical protein